jgi:acyl-CoA hydrolase
VEKKYHVPKNSYMPVKYTSAEEAVKEIKGGNRVFVHGSAATPLHLLKALFERKSELKNVELICITTLGDGVFDVADFGKSFFINSLFVSENRREIVNSNDGCYVPVFLSEIPLLFKKGILPVDIALIHVSPPDKHGYCSLGTSVDVAVSAIQNAHYTEMFSDGILPLIEKGIINNKFKNKHSGKIATSFAVGSRKLYDFIDDNPEVNFLTIDYVNDPRIISSNPEFGVANLFGKNLKQRTVALVGIAHPKHRENLNHEIFKRFGGLLV